MRKKRWFAYSLTLAFTLVLAACAQPAAPVEAPAVDTSGLESQIADLQAELDAAGATGGDELAALEAELAALQDQTKVLEQGTCSYNAYRMGWVMDWADAGNIVDTVFGPTSDFQYTFWQLTNPEAAAAFSDLTLSAYNDTDLDNRSATWRAAEQILIDEQVAVLPIYHYDRSTLVSTDVDPLFPPFGAPRMADWGTFGPTTMSWSAGASVPTLDVNRATDTTSSTVIYQMYDAPYKFNSEGGIEPLAATSFDVSDDGTVFTVHLREDGTWSDGEPVLAQHYVDGVTRLLSPDLANDYAYVMFDIVDAADYNSGDLAELNTIKALDDYTFEFTLSEPRSYFDSILAFSTFHPVRLDIIEAFGDEWTRPGNAVSNGAFVLVEHNPGNNLIMEKNELYWDAANVAFDRIEIAMIAEPATSLAAFENGEILYTAQGSFPSEDIPRLVDTPEFRRTPRPGTYYLGLNTAAVHTDNATFRKALSSAVDRRTILDEVAEVPWRTEATGVIPPEIVGYQGSAVGFPFDLAAAAGYLDDYMAEAGIEDAGDIVIELWYNKGGANQEILEAVEAMWETNLGIDVRTVNVEWATYLDTLEECNAIGGGGF
jgi:oligopeptide transport system substrate-binding protein